MGSLRQSQVELKHMADFLFGREQSLNNHFGAIASKIYPKFNEELIHSYFLLTLTVRAKAEIKVAYIFFSFLENRPSKTFLGIKYIQPLETTQDEIAFY